MSTRQPRYSKEESARRGQEIYERQIRPQVEEGNRGKIVAIDIESGAFKVAGDTLAASDRLLARYPDVQIWFVRIGHRSLHRFGQRQGETITHCKGASVSRKMRQHPLGPCSIQFDNLEAKSAQLSPVNRAEINQLILKQHIWHDKAIGAT
jgi:hypothetical protein